MDGRRFNGRTTPLSATGIRNIADANRARRRPWRERFEEKLDRNGSVPAHRPELGGCWEWIPAQSRPRGERRLCLLFKAEGVAKPFYHWLYEDEHGPTFTKRGPGGIEADHACLNWRCARPSHIEPVTHQENMRRFKEARQKGLI